MTTRIAALVAIVLLFLPGLGRAAETLSDADRVAILGGTASALLGIKL